MRPMHRLTTVLRPAQRLAIRAAAALALALPVALFSETASAAPSGPPPLKSSELVEALRLAGMDDDSIRRALAAYPPYLERAMAAQRERVEPLKSLKRPSADAAPEEQLKSAQESARAMRSASEAVEAAERELVDAVVASVPESDYDARQRVDSVLAFRLTRRAAAAWMRDRMVGMSPGACAADPREAISRIALADDVRARALERIQQYEWIAAPVLRMWCESCADVVVARARGADLDQVSRRIAAAAPLVGWSTQIGTQLRAMLADIRGMLPPAEYEQFRTNLLRNAYPSVFANASRADRAMLSALKKAAKGLPDAQAAARNEQRYRDWAAARDTRCNSLMEAVDRGMPVGPMLTAMLAPMMAKQPDVIPDAAAASELAKAVEDMNALRALAGESAGQLEGLDPSEMLPEWAMELPEAMGMPAGESSVTIAIDQSVTAGETGAAEQAGAAAGGASADGSGAAESGTTTTSMVISSAVAISTEGAGDGGIDISGPVQVVAFSTIDGASMLGEGLEISVGDMFGDDGMISLEYSGGDDLILPSNEQNIDETRITRSMTAPRTDASSLPSLMSDLRDLGVPPLSQPSELAVRDAFETYSTQHAALVRALAMEWSGRDPDAPPPTEAATQQEQIQQAMERGAEEMRRASDTDFIERRFGAWRRAPAAYVQLEAALLDGVAQAIAIGSEDPSAPALKSAVAALRERRVLAVERDLVRASGRPASLDMGGYAASLDLQGLTASTPLSSADKAAAAGALNGYQPALTSLLAQRREAAVDIERTNQLMSAVALRQFTQVTGDTPATFDPASIEAALGRARTQHEEAMARGQSIGKRLEEWQVSQSDKLLAALTPAGRSRVAAALTRAKHPTVARDSTSADPQIARAMSMVESDDSLLQAVISVAGEYQAAYDAIFARLVEADAARQSAAADLAAATAKSPRDEAAVAAARTRRSAANREVTRLRTERSELNARTLRALRAALGAKFGQEIADLPPRRPMPRLVTPS